MNCGATTLFGLALATLGCAAGKAQTNTIYLNTTRHELARWSVSEISAGRIKTAPALFNGKDYWGRIASIKIPFKNCDGFWFARRRFHIPVGATNLVLNITGLAVDDRAVLELNHVRITSVGTVPNGPGFMQFHDPGHNEHYYFQFSAGKVSFQDTVDLRPGLNELKVIVNNTNKGILGKIQHVSGGSPSSFGLKATVTYTP